LSSVDHEPGRPEHPRSFARQTLRVLEQNPGIVPPSLDTAAAPGSGVMDVALAA
jgi:hypothetical protein